MNIHVQRFSNLLANKSAKNAKIHDPAQRHGVKIHDILQWNMDKTKKCNDYL